MFSRRSAGYRSGKDYCVLQKEENPAHFQSGQVRAKVVVESQKAGNRVERKSANKGKITRRGKANFGGGNGQDVQAGKLECCRHRQSYTFVQG